MGDDDVTTCTLNTRANYAWELPPVLNRESTDGRSDDAGDDDVQSCADGVRKDDDGCRVSPLETVIEEERSRLMLADSVLGCLQIALDPEAVRVMPEPYFPEVLGLARRFINEAVRHLEYEEVRRLVRGSVGYWS